MRNLLSYFCICVFCLLSCNADNKTKPLKADDVIAEKKASENEKDEPLDEIERIAVFSKCTNYDNNLSTVAAKVDYISLDVEPPISDFHTTDIKLSDEYIFLAGLYHIYQYDKTGKFIRTIGSRGGGPKEYVQLGIPIQIDNDNDLIYGLDTNRRRIIVYRFDGSFAKAISYKYDGTPDGLTLIDSTRLVFRQTVGDRFSPNCPILHFINGEGKKIKTCYSHLYPIPRPTDRNATFGPDTNPLWKTNDRFYSLEYGSDTIFQIVKDSLIPTRILTGDLKLTFAEYFIRNSGKKLSILPYVLRPDAGIFESTS
ncbi:MAG: 6-bladed beta-propeller, partial [Tannerella sp.]|nr:6-bladed beta-propeller [Tannerella sp.]